MSLLTKPSPLSAATKWIYSLMQTVYDDIYDKIGTTTSGRGTLTWENLAANAAIAATQIANTAAVLGGGATQAMTNPFKMTAPMLDYSASNIATPIAVGSGVATFAIAEPTKLIQPLTFANTVAVDAVITTITGGTAGRTYIFVATNSDAAQTLSFSNTATNTVNTFKLRQPSAALSSAVCPPSSINTLGVYVFGDLNGSGVNQFWQI